MTAAATGNDKRLGVLVGVDGSPASNVAVAWAARDAEMRNLPLTIVHVVNADVATWPPMPYPETWAVVSCVVLWARSVLMRWVRFWVRGWVV